MASNFAALSPTDLKFSALKDLNPFKTDLEVQEASSILGGILPCQSDLIFIGNLVIGWEWSLGTVTT